MMRKNLYYANFIIVKFSFLLLQKTYFQITNLRGLEPVTDVNKSPNVRNIPRSGIIFSEAESFGN